MEKILQQLNPWWQNKSINTGIRRTHYLDILHTNRKQREIIFLLGSRRVGKTTIMKQWIQDLIDQQIATPSQILYLLLDHPELDTYTISEIIETAENLNGEPKYILLDEIQHRKGWDQELKALYETRSIKFILSGSAITILSKQKSYLTGRYLKYIVRPLQFAEFQQFTPQATILDYLTIGGYPEYVLQQNPQYLLDLIDQIVYKDIVEVYNIRYPKIFADLLLILARSVGHKISLAKIAHTLQISIETVRMYIHYLEEVYLIHELPKWSHSLNEKIYNEKKYYFYDTGLCNVLTREENIGSLAENVTVNFLKQQSGDVSYFYHDQRECDFIIRQLQAGGAQTITPVESKFDPRGKDILWNDQRLTGFYRAVEELQAQRGLIVTHHQTGSNTQHTNDVQMVSLESLLRGEVQL